MYITLDTQPQAMSSDATTTISPFNRLPLELLTEIFILNLPEPVREVAREIKKDSIRTIPPRNLLHVCRRWRSVVESTPKLWSQWAFIMFIRNEDDSRTLTRLIQQYVALSGNSPLSFYMDLRCFLHRIQVFQCILLSTQHRWKRVNLSRPGLSIYAAQLARAPLCELTLESAADELKGVSDTLIFSKLKYLHIYSCHPSHFKLLPLATKLEQLVIRSFQDDRPLPNLPPLHLKHLHRLSVSPSWTVLSKLTCPALLHFEVRRVNLPVFEAFIQRSRPSLQSLDIDMDRASELLPSLSFLPSLLSLTAFARLDQAFLDDMDARDSAGVEFKMCPLLQEFTLTLRNTGRDVERVVGLITSRWDAPIRTIRKVRLIGAGFWFTPTRSSLTGLSGPWVPLVRCIREGLVFESMG